MVTRTREKILWRRRGFTAFLLILFAGLLAGCDTGTIGGDVNIPGTLPQELVWKWDSGSGDIYTITKTTIQYYYPDPLYGFDSDITGNIRFVSNYSGNSGVIIIEYTEGKIGGAPYNPKKPFAAIYYQNLSGNKVQLANAVDLANNYASADTATLKEAVGKFTLGKRGDYVWRFGTYIRVNP